MDDFEERIAELRKLAETLTVTERKRQQSKIIGRTVSIKNQLDRLDKKLKRPEHTVGDVKKHMQLLTELRLLYRTDEKNAPISVIEKEVELVTEMYDKITKTYQQILTDADKKF